MATPPPFPHTIWGDVLVYFSLYSYVSARCSRGNSEYGPPTHPPTRGTMRDIATESPTRHPGIGRDVVYQRPPIKNLPVAWGHTRSLSIAARHQLSRRFSMSPLGGMPVRARGTSGNLPQTGAHINGRRVGILLTKRRQFPKSTHHAPGN